MEKLLGEGTIESTAPYNIAAQSPPLDLSLLCYINDSKMWRNAVEIQEMKNDKSSPQASHGVNQTDPETSHTVKTSTRKIVSKKWGSWAFRDLLMTK